MKVKFGKVKSDPVAEAQEEEAALRQKLEAAEKRRAELEERTAKTPILTVKNIEEAEEAAEKLEASVPPVPPVKLTKAQQAAVDALRVISEALEPYAGAFPEMGPSGHADIERTLLLACFAELRGIRAALEK